MMDVGMVVLVKTVMVVVAVTVETETVVLNIENPRACLSTKMKEPLGERIKKKAWSWSQRIIRPGGWSTGGGTKLQHNLPEVKFP